MKKALALVLAIALTAAIAVGGTLAYLTDTDEDVNVMTIGKVKIDQLEFERIDTETADQNATVQEFHDNKPLYPAVIEDGFDYTKPGATYVDWEQIGKNDYTSDIWDPSKINNEVDKMVFVKNKGDYDAYVRSVFAFEAGKYTTLDEFQKMVHLNLNTSDYSWEWVETPVAIPNETDGTTITNYFVAIATYNKVLAPGTLTEISLSQIALDPAATNADVEAFGETYQVLVKTQGIQADGFDDPNTALNEGFGSNIPFQNDNPIKGIDVRTALHYLDGDTTGTVISDSVTNVIFGLTSKHSTIADNYVGTLVDVEQDVPVYAYYVPDGGTYTVYFLANDDIFLPKDSSNLFMDMDKLETVDTYNLNTSRTVNMSGLFNNCDVLKKVSGTEKWDTSKVTVLDDAFNLCVVLPELNVTGWDVSNVVSSERMFNRNYALASLPGHEDWVMSANKSAWSMFERCSSLTELDATNWDLSSMENMRGMFCRCTALKQVAGMGEWDTGNLQSTWDMFARCSSLETLEGMANWNLDNAVNFAGMLQGCTTLVDEDIEEIYYWDTSNLEDISWFFKGCTGLVNIDLSNWDTSNVKKFNSLFSSYNSNKGDMNIVSTGIENWDTSNGDNMGYMFYGCGDLVSIDLSGWDVSKNTTFNHFFTDCYNLKNVNFTDWDTSSVEIFAAMFNNCNSIEYLDLSDFDTESAVYFDQMFEYCAKLKEIKGLENWDTSNVISFYEMFSGCSSLTELNLSSFNTAKVADTFRNFNGCSNLKTIYVGDGWDMSMVTSYGAMFSGCNNLVGGAGTTFEGSDLKYAHVDGGAENPGYLTHINDKPVEKPTA